MITFATASETTTPTAARSTATPVRASTTVPRASGALSGTAGRSTASSGCALVAGIPVGLPAACADYAPGPEGGSASRAQRLSAAGAGAPTARAAAPRVRGPGQARGAARDG